MSKAQIAKKLGTSKTLVGYLVSNQRKTTNIQLAIAVAKLTGRKPTDFISERIRPLAVKIYPGLNKRSVR